MDAFLQLFRLSPASWAAFGPTGLPRSALTAVGAWTLLAWGRLGLQALTSPRATVRFVLIGFYAWLVLSLVIWGVTTLAERLSVSVSEAQGTAARDPAMATGPGGVGVPAAERAMSSVRGLAGWDGLVRIVAAVGSAHRPLVFLGIAIQLLQLVGLLGGPGAVFAAVTMAWMAATLSAALAWVTGRPFLFGLAIALLPFSLWLATVGRFALTQVGHLL